MFVNLIFWKKALFSPTYDLSLVYVLGIFKLMQFFNHEMNHNLPEYQTVFVIFLLELILS